MGNVIITGANRGIGKALLLKYASKGWNIWACSRRKNKEFEELIFDIQNRYDVWIKPIYFDLKDCCQIKNGIKEIFSHKQPIDVLVNNAAVGNYELFQRISIDQAKEIFDVNFWAPYQIMQYVLRKMMNQKKGSIINVSSIASLDANQGDSVYGASKAALNILTKDAAAEMGRVGIRINAVAPGPVDTDLLNTVHITKLKKELVKQNSALGRLGEVDEIANVIYFLSTEQSSFINGEIIRIDGGRK